MTDATQDSESARWHYHPEGPVSLNPLFNWPPRPAEVLRWYSGAWLQITSLTLCMVLAVTAYVLFFPGLEAMQSFAPGWMFRIWLLNIVPQILVAGGLHWWLYMRKGQGMYKKFDRRDLTRNNGNFTFRNQVWDNIWWTLGSAMSVATVYQWIIYWAMANGYVPVVTWASAPVWFVLWMAFIPMWSGLHFYWVHRLEHHPKLYKHVHAVHHRNVNVGPWSGLSMHPVEHVLFFSSVLIHFVVPANPVHVLFHMQHQALTAATSHSGFENLLVKDRRRLALGTFHHQMHHRYFEVNYGNLEMPWDRWFGTFHDGTVDAHERLRERRLGHS